MPHKLKWPRCALLAVGAVVVFGAALAIAEHHLEALLVRVIKARTGRDIRVDGAFEAHFLTLHPTIRANQVSIGSPPWMPAGAFAHVGRLSLIFAWQASIRPLEIRRLEMEDAVLHLVRDSTGRANWNMHATEPGKSPPLIRSLSMPNAHVELNDDRRHLQFSGSVSVGDAIGGGVRPPFRMEGAGLLNGRAASFVIEGDPLLQARSDRPYHFTLEEHSGAAQLVGRGALTHPFDLLALQGTFDMVGPDLSDLYYLVGLRLPHTGPFRLFGQLARHGMRFVYSGLRATSGKSDISGTLSVDGTSIRPRIEGQLSSELLRLADIGAHAAGLAAKTSLTRLSDTPFRLDVIRRDDASVQYRAGALLVGPEELDSLNALVSLDHSALSIQGFRASLADGTIFGSARLDASHQVPRGDLDLHISDLQLDRLKGSNGAPAFTGSLSGRVQLRGEGESFHKLAANMDGTITAVVPHGSMRASIADVAGLDLIGALLKSRERTDIRCAVASFDAHDGVLTTRTFVIGTDKVLITGSGDVQMGSERIDLTLRGVPTRAGLARRSAVSIQGTLSHPEIRGLGHDVLGAALNVVLEPVGAVLAFVDPKLPRNADCAALVAQAKTAVLENPRQQRSARTR